LLIALLRIAELREAPDRRQKHEAERAENARLVREQEGKEGLHLPALKHSAIAILPKTKTDPEYEHLK
jgi:hypothetical protein